VESPNRYRTIIVALDGSSDTEAKLLTPAREFATIFGASLVLMRAVDLDILPAKDDPMSAPSVAIAAGPPMDQTTGLAVPGVSSIPGDDFVPARAVEDQNATGYLNILSNQLEADGFQVEHVEPAENPAEALIAEAGLREAPLIVMGTHHRSSWERLFKGSTSEKVLRHSPCPVLVIPLD
jgi:nucleotide-binding universal stress UspA family protein